MSNRKIKISNKKKGDGNGHSVIDNHEYSNRVSTTSSQSSTSFNDKKVTKDNKNDM